MLKIVSSCPELELEPLHRFVRTEVLPGARERDEREEFPLKLLDRLHGLGYITAFVPQELGGVGAPTPYLLWVIREVAYASPGMACSMIGNMLALVPLLMRGNRELRHKVAQETQERLSLASFCFTEPEAGSDILRIRTRAEKVPGGYRISGQKCFITNANYAEHYIVMARTDSGDGPRAALSMFYVPGGSKGLSTGKALTKLGHRDSNTSEVYFDGVFVPEENLIGKEGEGLRNAQLSLARSRTFFAASAVGLMDRVSDLLTDFLSGREHYGKPLLSQPAIRNQLCQLRTEAHAAWLLTCSSAAEWEAGNPSLHHSSMAKMYAGQVASRFATSGLELFGGWGYTREYEIERLYRDAKLYEIIEGPTFVQQAIIAKELYPEPKPAKASEKDQEAEQKKKAA